MGFGKDHESKYFFAGLWFGFWSGFGFWIRELILVLWFWFVFGFVTAINFAQMFAHSLIMYLVITNNNDILSNSARLLSTNARSLSTNARYLYAIARHLSIKVRRLCISQVRIMNYFYDNICASFARIMHFM